MQRRYDEGVGIHPDDDVEFNTPAVEIDESLFTHFD